MKHELEGVLRTVENLLNAAVDDEDSRLLREAHTRLILVWDNHKDDPPRSPRGQAASIDEALNRGDGSYRP